MPLSGYRGVESGWRATSHFQPTNHLLSYVCRYPFLSPLPSPLKPSLPYPPLVTAERSVRSALSCSTVVWDGAHPKSNSVHLKHETKAVLWQFKQKKISPNVFKLISPTRDTQLWARAAH